MCIYYVSRLDFFTINSIKVTGGETIAHEILYDIVSDELDGTYFRLIPKRFTYLYPKDRISESLEKVPRIHEVKLERDGRKKLIVTFSEYLPHALWCLEDSPETRCFFIDQTGYAFMEAPQLHGGALIRHVVPQDTFQTGEVLEKEKLETINRFVSQIENVLGFRINAVSHMPENDISFSVSGGGHILISLNNDTEKTFEDISATLQSEEFQSIEPGEFQYIDARFENKIFVNEEVATSSATSSESLPES